MKPIISYGAPPHVGELIIMSYVSPPPITGPQMCPVTQCLLARGGFLCNPPMCGGLGATP